MKNMSQSTDPQFPPHENTPLITTAQPGSAYLLESITGEEISSNLKPLDKINGYDVRPGFYEVNGASALPGGVNFTLASHGATSCELLLFHRKSSCLLYTSCTHNGVKPYAAFLFYLYVAQYNGIRRCKYIVCNFRGFHGIISFVVSGLLLLCNIMFCCLYSYIMPFHVRSVNWYFVSVCVHFVTGLLYALSLIHI